MVLILRLVELVQYLLHGAAEGSDFLCVAQHNRLQVLIRAGWPWLHHLRCHGHGHRYEWHWWRQPACWNGDGLANHGYVSRHWHSLGNWHRLRISNAWACCSWWGRLPIPCRGRRSIAHSCGDWRCGQLQTLETIHEHSWPRLNNLAWRHEVASAKVHWGTTWIDHEWPSIIHAANRRHNQVGPRCVEHVLIGHWWHHVGTRRRIHQILKHLLPTWLATCNSLRWSLSSCRLSCRCCSSILWRSCLWTRGCGGRSCRTAPSECCTELAPADNAVPVAVEQVEESRCRIHCCHNCRKLADF
mmetsp:Transcript_26392/g.61468  ORF Transcript_26392/g.61468 Transcript_26392/m.61468 type:complete len:300 (-) Transcript_26392:107-1006(-)